MAVLAAVPGRKSRGVALRRVAGLVAEKAVKLAAQARVNALTVAGIGSIDVGFFVANSVVGWIGTGISLLVLDWKFEK